VAKNSPSFDKKAIEKLASELGFSACRFARARLPQNIGDDLKAFVDAGNHGTMEWLADTLERRTSPEHMWPEAKSAIVLAMNYGPSGDPLQSLSQKSRGSISVYAQNRDYHDLIKGRLKQIAQRIAGKYKCEVKVFVDTAPLMEKPLAHQAGLGWQGKHTNLVSREFGSWIFLGTILTDLEISPDEPETDHCGNCRACLDICPTNAFSGPYRINAGKCISYLTIEHKGPIPLAYRKPMGNRIYGCDDCLAVCPWNKFAVETGEMKLSARDDLKGPLLANLLELDDAGFRHFFSASPIKRIGRSRFLRNVLIAAGNSTDDALIDRIEPLLGDNDPLVRGAAVWALSQLMESQTFNLCHKAHINRETDASVLSEWQQAITHEKRPE